MKKIFMIILACSVFCAIAAEGRAGLWKAGNELETENLSPVGEATGERYRFIDDDVLPESGSASVVTRTYLYAGMMPVSMTENARTLYFGTDVRGSVRTLTDRYGTVTATADYDAFGVPRTDAAIALSRLGYAGKTYDSITGLSNFGFRDYSAETGRFTTTDPIRSGLNWYAYVSNDPVSYVDLWGLTNIKPVELSMQDSRWGALVLGNSSASDAALIQEAGCYLTGYSSAAITLTENTAYTPEYFNGMSVLFDSEQNFNSTEASEITGLTNDYWTKNKQGNLNRKINELQQSDTEYVVMAQVPYNSDGDLHWVEIYGGADDDGWVNVIGTSVNDSNKAGSRGNLTDVWDFSDSTVKIQTSEIEQIRTFTYNQESDESMNSKCHD